jgi:hypothetical protein
MWSISVADIRTRFQNIRNAGDAFIVGEFADDGADTTYQNVMDACRAEKASLLAWEWSHIYAPFSTTYQAYCLAVRNSSSDSGDSLVQNSGFNLVQNPGFEGQMTNWTVVVGGNATTVTSPIHTGNYALQVGATAWSWVQQSILGYAVDSTYTFSAWGKVASVGQSVQVGIKCDAGTIGTLTFATTSYVQKAATVTIPAGTTWVLVYVTNPTTGTGYADDISLVNEDLSIDILDTKDNNGFSIYPNPVTNGVLYLTSVENSIISLFSIDGKKVMNFRNTPSNAQINVSGLIPGLYILKVQIDTQILQKKLIIK